MNWLEDRRLRVKRLNADRLYVPHHPSERLSDTPIITISGERQSGKTELILDRLVRHANEGLNVIFVAGTFTSAGNTFRRLEDLRPTYGLLHLPFKYRRAHGETGAISPGGGRIDFRACTEHNFAPDLWDVAVFDDTLAEPMQYVGERVKLIYRLTVQ